MWLSCSGPAYPSSVALPACTSPSYLVPAKEGRKEEAFPLRAAADRRRAYHSSTKASLHFTRRRPTQANNGRSFPRRRRRQQQRALTRAPPRSARRAAAVDEESRSGAGRQDGGDGGARGGRRGRRGQHVPHRRRRRRRPRRHRLPHLLLPQGHVPRVRRRRVRAQVRRDAAGQRGEEGPGADRLRQLQRARQARPDRQVAASSINVLLRSSGRRPVDRSLLRLPPPPPHLFSQPHAWDAGILQELNDPYREDGSRSGRIPGFPAANPPP